MQRGFAANEQSRKKLCREFPDTVIYSDADDCIESLRGDSVLIVVDLAELGDRTNVLSARIARIEKSGANVIEVSTGRSKLEDWTAMVVDAASRIRRGHSSERAAEYGRKGGRPRMERTTTEEVARANWFDTIQFSTCVEAAAATPGWTESAMRSTFGRSGRRSGPRKQ